MARATYLHQPTIERIPQLLEQIRDRVVSIPRFQRPFVWTDKQRLELMESIYSGIPIGSLLVWRTRDHKLATYRLRGTREQDNPAEDSQYQYVLDGHQRLVTLFTALGSDLFGVEEGEEEDGLVDDDDDYRNLRPIYFDLESKAFVLGRDRGQSSPLWFPLSDLFDDYRFYEFQKELGEGESAKKYMSRLRNLHKSFYDYTIAVVPLMTDDIDVATKTFERVNSAGTSMSELHMVKALTYFKDFDLSQRLEAIAEELSTVGWQDIEPQTILDVCKVTSGLPIHLKGVADLARTLKKNPVLLLARAKSALVAAAQFLARACDIYGPKTLPYSYQIVLLADVLVAHDEDADLDLRLAQWLWVTTYSEYFAGMNATRLRQALEHLRKVASGEANPEPDDLPHEIRPPRRFDFRAARSRAMALMMADSRPVSPRNRPYPAHKILARYGGDVTPKLLSSSEVGAKESEGFENRFIASPSDANLLRRSILEGHLDVDGMRSHGITPAAAKALAARRYTKFLALRRDFFLYEEGEFVRNLGLSYSDDP
jgi:hypothetical protein